MRIKTLLPLACVAAGSLALAGCTTGSSSGSPAAGGEMSTDTIRTTLEVPTSFDPTQTLGLPDFWMARMGFDTLVRQDNGGEFAAGLAESWDVRPTGTTFTLRDGITCSDGTPITPTVVKDSLEYLADPKTASPVIGQVFGPGNTATIQADDEAGTVDVTLEKPWPDLLAGLAMSSAGVICPAGLEDPKALADGTAEGAQSGPYVLSDRQHGVSYTFTLRDDYDAWPQYNSEVAGVPAKNLVFDVVADRNTQANLLLSDQLDIIQIDGALMERFQNEPAYTVAAQPFSDFFVVFNQREGSPFRDPEIRKAVAQVLDAKTFEDITSNGHGQTSRSLVAEGTTCAAPEEAPVIKSNPEAAKKVLKGVDIRLVGPNIAGPQGSGNVYIQEQLRAAGANVTLKNSDVGSWIGQVFGEPSSWDMTMYADLNFPGTMANPLTAFVGPTIQEGGANVGATDNAEAEQAFEDFRTAEDEAAACAALQESMHSLIANADAIPLSNNPRLTVAAEGFEVSHRGTTIDDPILRITQ
ncbi:ABC transporter substrate-binding protein [Arthrobacter crystallopoietes]|uniref:ABC transporter substrate-binding protein n=1 Tax=Crystallibacter crystallopoietes TaxID=37928 RepID=UPI001ABEA68C|nr:ABC transporter substrate-binding protein [Arthrobacter crystallopoietes]QTG82088.1 ABC transporter substrate-binding protein [Arthrobacter crystallopoietes]